MNPACWLLAQDTATRSLASPWIERLPESLRGVASTAAGWLDQAPAPLFSWFVWAIAFAAFGVWLLIPQGRRREQAIGALFCAISLGLFAGQVRPLAGLAAGGVFWVLAGITIAAAVATISARSPVYSAIWFAMTLLGSAGLFLFQGAQFLGVATVVVYAGAIVVTFLFVLMLAQPEGHETYDRISWGRLPTAASAFAGALIVGLLTTTLVGLNDAPRVSLHEQVAELVAAVAPAPEEAATEELADKAGEEDAAAGETGALAAPPRPVALRHVSVTRSPLGNPLLVLELIPAADGSRLSAEQANDLRRRVIRLVSNPVAAPQKPAGQDSSAATTPASDGNADDEGGDESDDEAAETSAPAKSPSLIEVIRDFKTEDGKPLIPAERILAARRHSLAGGQPQVVLELLEIGPAGRLSQEQFKKLKWEIGHEAIARAADEYELVVAYRTYEVELKYQDTRTDQHMAHLGRRLFSEQLVSVEVAGTLLLVALVGAVAIVIQGQGPRGAAGGDEDE